MKRWCRRECVLRTFARKETDADTFAAISGIPTAQHGRKVTIYAAPKLTTQGGFGQSTVWRVSFDREANWDNPLMGWASGRDTLAAQVSLKFNTKEDAIAYALEHGWLSLFLTHVLYNPSSRIGFEYQVDESNSFNQRPAPKNYGTKIKYQPARKRPEEEL